ncbi:hypothetical protein AB835_09190 [Candidatus Endobugula sertula]|uniref:EXPERA domain-containing protein n=1 Tax=Candidatus Endobugula sertula TaxID=62101 RepID=A0A1D2QP68_9GAMM|nr:hypothetical protein AB835_09190 [Candidatus Endobugula sertula]
MANDNGIPKDLKCVWIISFGCLVFAFPIYSYLAFGLELDRNALADIFATHVAIAYWTGMGAAFLPLPGLKNWSKVERLKYVCLAFMLASYLTHLSWQLLWLVFHETISNSKNEIWAYAWWAYIDGGDVRYYNPEPHFLMIEILSVINGSIGLVGLYFLLKSEFKNILGILLCMSTAVTHTILTWHYYGEEMLTGFESVNISSFNDLWIKFIFLNGPWLVFPWLVLFWGYTLIQKRTSEV